MKNIELKEKLVSLRKENGLTQLAVAEKMNISRQAISRWESGMALPSTDNLKCLGALYGVSIDYLLNENSDRKNKLLDDETAADKNHHKNKKAAIIIAIALAGVLIVGILGYFLIRNNGKTIDVANAESDQWSESQTEIEMDW